MKNRFAPGERVDGRRRAITARAIAVVCLEESAKGGEGGDEVDRDSDLLSCEVQEHVPASKWRDIRRPKWRRFLTVRRSEVTIQAPEPFPNRHAHNNCPGMMKTETRRRSSPENFSTYDEIRASVVGRDDWSAQKKGPVLSDLRTGRIQIGGKGEPNSIPPTLLHTLWRSSDENEYV